MKQPTDFPNEYQAGGMVFRIYWAPVAKTNKDGTETTHPSFLVKHYKGDVHVQKRQKSWEDVETYIEEVVAAHRANDPERLELTGRDRRNYLAAVDALEEEKVKCDVDHAAREFAAATNMLCPFNLDVKQAAKMISDALTRLGKVPLST